MVAEIAVRKDRTVATKQRRNLLDRRATMGTFSKRTFAHQLHTLKTVATMVTTGLLGLVLVYRHNNNRSAEKLENKKIN